MSTIYNILITFSSLETFKEMSGFGPVDMSTAFGEKLQRLAKETYCSIEFAEQHYGLILVLFDRKGFPRYIDAFKLALKRQRFTAPEAIQVSYQCGESDFDPWQPIINEFNYLENWKPPVCHLCEKAPAVDDCGICGELFCNPCFCLDSEHHG